MTTCNTKNVEYDARLFKVLTHARSANLFFFFCEQCKERKSTPRKEYNNNNLIRARQYVITLPPPVLGSMRPIEAKGVQELNKVTDHFPVARSGNLLVAVVPTAFLTSRSPLRCWWRCFLSRLLVRFRLVAWLLSRACGHPYAATPPGTNQ